MIIFLLLREEFLESSITFVRKEVSFTVLSTFQRYIKNSPEGKLPLTYGTATLTMIKSSSSNINLADDTNII